MRIATIGFSILFLALRSYADVYSRQPSIDVVHYEISIELTGNSDSISAKARVHVMMRQDSISQMWLDFADMKVDQLLVGGVERPFVHRDGRLSFSFDRTYFRHEIAMVEVHYHGKSQKSGMLIEKNKHGRRVFFSENWPDRARSWFPAIDHPSDKATVDFVVTAPEKYEVVSNGQLIETRPLFNGRKLTRWSESKPIPTYCMAIGVAEFSIVPQGNFAGVPLVLYSYPQDSEMAAQKFRRSNSMLQYFSELIGPYPYEKLAQVEATTSFGGMENASAIFFNEASFEQMLFPESFVPHEIAHQWFGNSVTAADWDHLWLNEGFATYFDALFYEYLQGPEALRQTMALASQDIKQYPPTSVRPIINSDHEDPTEKLNALNYQKGAWVLHMLRKVLGDEIFFNGIRHYYSLYKNANALTEDFQRVMESAGNTSLKTFFRQWLYQPGWPDYHVSWHWQQESSEVEINIYQAQTTGLFDMPLDIVFLIGNQRKMHTFQVTDASHTLHIPLEGKPSAIEIDPEGWVLKSVTVINP